MNKKIDPVLIRMIIYNNDRLEINLYLKLYIYFNVSLLLKT